VEFAALHSEPILTPRQNRQEHPDQHRQLDTVDNPMADEVAVPRFYAMLVAGFASLARIVSGAGVFGTVNHAVTRQTREIGIRMALGAERGDVVSPVLGLGVLLIAAGLVLGLARAWASARVLETLLFGVRPTDAVTFACG
jgi:ABC-type antimicrobial peptide transport system permease subunit